MVATSLPFWMQHSSRSMSPFTADSAMRLGASVAPAERRAPEKDLIGGSRAAGLFVEVCDAQAVGAYEEAWIALASRALEPNVFLEPGFALPAMRHFPPARRPTFLLVWSGGEGGRAALVGLCALKPGQAAYGVPVAAAWTHEQATLSAPLLDRDRAGDVLDLVLEVLARQSSPLAGLLLQGVAADGALMRLLAERGYPTRVIERRQRTVLRRMGSEAGVDAKATTAKRAKEMRRQKRRLGDGGAFSFRSARSPEEIRLATEQFLHLEARGWKGGRGTALLSDVGLAAFTRAMTRQLARMGLCRIDSLEIGGEPAAMGIVLKSGDRAFFWKTSYDERWKRHSPGKQLADLMREVQLADPAVALTDSCAVPDHPMIGHVWPDSMTVLDILVAGSATPPARLDRAAGTLALVRRLRRAAKAGYQLARGVLRLR